MGAGDRFVLEVPPAAEYVGTARIFLGAIARFLEVDDEAVEDLKLAASEACGMAVRDRVNGVPTPVRVVAERTEQGLMVQILDPEGPAAPGGSDSEPTPDAYARAVSLDVIRALFEDARIDEAPGGGRRVAFTLASG